MSHQQPSFRRFTSLLRAFLAAGTVAITLGVGCSSDEKSCGGIETDDGKCLARCSDAGCAANNRCVNNACAALCVDQGDCELGTNCVNVNFSETDSGTYCVDVRDGKIGQDGESCADDTECDTYRGYQCVTVDGTAECRATGCTSSSECDDGFCKGGGDAGGESVNYCQPGSDGRSGDCSSNSDCDQFGGFACVNNTCALSECTKHSDCQGFGLCSFGGTDSEGNTVNFCDPTLLAGEEREAGQFGTNCVNGPDDCAEGFDCLGAGEGDLDAYCTKFDCTSDDDCGTGYHCARVRVGSAPCAAGTCPGIGGDPTDPECVGADAIGPGKQYECGALNLRRNVCRRADYCSPCETHEDCLAEAGQVCAKDVGGVKRCTVPCDPDTRSCPWGNASTCNVFDEDLGFATCAHRFGSCTGEGKSCEPCVTSTDCGDTGFCASSPNTGEKFCVDLATECSCEGFPSLGQSNPYACEGGTCPASPGGLKLTCYGFLDDPTSVINNRCFGANANQGTIFASSPQQGCWSSL